MKVLFISNFYPPAIFGGYELYARDIAEGLMKRGHEVCVLCSQTGGVREPYVRTILSLKMDNFYKMSHVNIFKKAFRFFFNRKNFAITREVISRINPDIISIWNLRLISIMPLIAATQSGRPVAMHLYDPWFIPIKIFKYFPRLRENLVDTGHIITCSKSLAYQYEMAGIKKKCITILPHGIDIPPEKRIMPSSNGKRLLIVSSLSKEKGVDIALKAFSILVNKRGNSNLTLNIYGKGDISYQKYLDTLIKREGIAPYIQFKGWIPRGALNEVFNEHQIFICPERWATLPLVLLEAMASGLPVVGINHKGMDEVILNGTNGLLVPLDDAESLADAIEKLYNSESLRKEMGMKARETIIGRFNIEEDIKKIEDYYLKVCRR